MVMSKWTQPVEKSSSSTTNPEEKYVMRPLWQRMALSAFEIAVGVSAGAVILASRDRTVWRVLVRRVPLSALPPGRPGMRPPPSSSSASRTVNVLSLESGSGRTKRYLMRDCTLSSGRDHSELFLNINGIRGNFVLAMNGARVLGADSKDVFESPALKELALAKDAEDVDALNSQVPGASEPPNVALGELRKGLARAWITVGGSLALPRKSSQAQGWTSGPAAEGSI